MIQEALMPHPKESLWLSVQHVRTLAEIFLKVGRRRDRSRMFSDSFALFYVIVDA